MAAQSVNHRTSLVTRGPASLGSALSQQVVENVMCNVFNLLPLLMLEHSLSAVQAVDCYCDISSSSQYIIMACPAIFPLQQWFAVANRAGNQTSIIFRFWP